MKFSYYRGGYKEVNHTHNPKKALAKKEARQALLASGSKKGKPLQKKQQQATPSKKAAATKAKPKAKPAPPKKKKATKA